MSAGPTSWCRRLELGAACLAHVRIWLPDEGPADRPRLASVEVVTPSGRVAQRFVFPWRTDEIRAQDTETRRIARRALEAGAPLPAEATCTR